MPDDVHVHRLRIIHERPGAGHTDPARRTGHGARRPLSGPLALIRTVASLVTAAGLLAGCQNEIPATAGSPKAAAAAPRAVKVVQAAEESVARTVAATGTLAADEQIVLGTKVVGRLAEITVDLGSRVRRGQPIARVDPQDYQYRLDQAIAALQQARARLGLPPDGTDDRVNTAETALVRQAKASLDQARLSRDRTARLVQSQLVAQADMDAAVTALEVAEGRYQDAIEEVHNRRGVLAQRRSELDMARQQLADTILASPFDGAVALRQASVGEYLAAGAPVVTLVRLDPIRLRFSVPERDAASVREGQAVRVTVEGEPAPHGGRVVRLSPAIAEQNRTLLVEAEIPNPRGVLRPGAFAKAEVVVQQGDKVVVVPGSAIVAFAGVEKVLAVRDGKSVELRVETGRRLGAQVEIVSGLKAGEAVVVQPGNLVGGQSVTVAQ